VVPHTPDAMAQREDALGPDVLDSGEGFDVRRLGTAILRYKWLVLLIIILGSAAGVVVTRFLSAEYQAQATIWIEVPSGRQAAGAGQQTLGMPLQPGALLGQQAWLHLLSSFAVLDHVVMEQRLFLRPGPGSDAALFESFGVRDDVRSGQYRLVVAVDEGGAGYTLETQAGEVLERGVAGDSVGAGLGFLWQPPVQALWPGRQAEFSVRRPRDVSVALSKELRSRIDNNNQFLRVELSGSNPREVAATVNAVVDRFVTLSTELKTEKVAELESILGQQLEQAGAYLREAEIALENFRVRTITLPSEIATPAPGLEMTQPTVIGNYFDKKHEREELSRDRMAIERVLREVRNGSDVPVLSLELIGSVGTSSELQQVLTQLTDLRVQARTLGRRYTDDHPSVRPLLHEIERLERQTVPAFLERVIAQLEAREAELDGVLASAARELQEIPPRISEEARLERHVETGADLYTNLRRNYEQARMAAATSFPDMRVLDRASEPTRPSSDTRRRLLAMMVLGSVGLALVGAILLDRVDPKLRYPEQVGQLGLVTLGSVPHIRKGKRTAAEVRTDAQLVESFRGIRMNLAYAYGSAGPILLTVSSPGPGDGKSFVSLNLALAFARSGHRTLLVDGDLRRGVLHDALGQVRVPGLTNYLKGDATLAQITRTTQYQDLSLIPAGTRRAEAPELLGSPAMGELLSSALASKYTAIVVDSPPLVAGVDPFVLGTLTRNLVLVLRTANTNRELAGLKLELVHRLPIRMLGAVLNDTPRGGAYRYYSYDPTYEAVDELAGEPREPQLIS
jgi:polysaccharide biosynthesis transport protein